MMLARTVENIALPQTREAKKYARQINTDRLLDSALDMVSFQLPPELEAGEPPEARGLARDQVRLMVSYLTDDRVIHTRFRALPDFLQAGDVVVINTSGTLNAALSVTRADGTPLELHLSTHLPANLWLVELRQPDKGTTRPFYRGQGGEVLALPGGGSAVLYGPYQPDDNPPGDQARLWVAALRLPMPVIDYLDHYGFPIRYSYVSEAWSLHYYQTIYATEPGSAEMPSAGRAFTPDLITQLVARGVVIAPLVLHTGVASLESHEPPYEEYYRLPPETANLVNLARAGGKRIIAVGTTVVRALETVANEDGYVHPGEGWTGLVITPARGLRVVDGMLTGLHEPEATHLAMLEALAGRRHLEITYGQALQERYLWHEFGDLHLILP
jgi:S-adenosylmethionine:tRNA ribosyltransferase-isomerase